MSDFYEIDFAAFIKMMLPVRLRKAVMLSWLNCLVQPVKDLYNTFSTNRSANLYELSHNSQVVYLQTALNDTFDMTGRGIYITDGSNDDPLYLYLIAENNPLWLGLNSEEGTTSYPDPQWLYTDAETAYSGYQFIVHVPTAIGAYDAIRMKALIDKYRLPSKNRYLIVNY